jgi:hypothetical protein
MRLLRRVPGIHFGPDVVTWQALVGKFAESTETFLYKGEHNIMSALTLESSEFGNLLDPQDKAMVDLLVNLWDGKQGAFEKTTKMSGNDVVENPWINLIACTTPSWIAGNFPEYMVGGGFTSRCIFVYADEKDKYVAYPGLHVPDNLEAQEDSLVADLRHIAENISGEYVLSRPAVAWGETWYQHHYENRPESLSEDRFGGYIARKQTHIHKLAMVLAASRSDKLIISVEDLQLANEMVTDLESDMPNVFAKIGRSDVSLQAERLLTFIARKGYVTKTEAYRYTHAYFPSAKEFDDVVDGLIRSGQIRVGIMGNEIKLTCLPPEAG